MASHYRPTDTECLCRITRSPTRRAVQPLLHDEGGLHAGVSLTGDGAVHRIGACLGRRELDPGAGAGSGVGRELAAVAVATGLGADVLGGEFADDEVVLDETGVREDE